MGTKKFLNIVMIVGLLSGSMGRVHANGPARETAETVLTRILRGMTRADIAALDASRFTALGIAGYESATWRRLMRARLATFIRLRGEAGEAAFERQVFDDVQKILTSPTRLAEFIAERPAMTEAFAEALMLSRIFARVGRKEARQAARQSAVRMLNGTTIVEVAAEFPGGIINVADRELPLCLRSATYDLVQGTNRDFTLVYKEVGVVRLFPDVFPDFEMSHKLFMTRGASDLVTLLSGQGTFRLVVEVSGKKLENFTYRLISETTPGLEIQFYSRMIHKDLRQSIEVITRIEGQQPITRRIIYFGQEPVRLEVVQGERPISIENLVWGMDPH